MSIYATLWRLRFPRYGDAHSGCSWVDVYAQAVPDQIEAPDFLPSERGEIDGQGYLAVVVVTSETKKGPPRGRAQEYVDALLVLSGADYAAASFDSLQQRISAALRGGRPRVISEAGQPDGRVKLIFEDGSAKVVEVDERP